MGPPEERIEANKTQGQIVKVACPECNGPTNHKVYVSADIQGKESYDEGCEISWQEHFQIVECQGCNYVSFRHLSWFSEYEDQASGNNGTTERLYPKRGANSLRIRDFLNVTPTPRRIYRETVECLNNDCLTLCAAGLRALVEGICADQSILDGPVEVSGSGGVVKTVRKSDLRGKIAGLYEKGVLTKPSTEILHSHRFLGNEAVHELKQPSFSELKLAVEIIEHILEQLYEIPVKANELRERSARRAAANKGS